MFHNSDSTSAIQNKAVSLRSSIKAAVAQLDQWDDVQEKQRLSREAAKARFSNFDERLAIAKYRAKKSFPSHASDPLCEHCESPFHSTDSCDILQTLEALERQDQVDSTSVAQLPSTNEDASTGIHRAIIHRLYSNACDLYRILYPRFYPGPKPRKSEPEILYPVPLSGPDYLAIAIHQASVDFQALPVDTSDIRHQHASCSLITHLYYSKAFPLTFSEFCARIADSVDESDSESV